MRLDADDYLDENALEIMYNKIKPKIKMTKMTLKNIQKAKIYRRLFKNGLNFKTQ